MTIVNIQEAKTHLSTLIQHVLNGEEVIIAKRGVPLARLTPYEKQTTKRMGGQLNGILCVKDDFDDPLPEDILRSFYGEERLK